MEGFGDDEMETYLERMVEEDVLMMVRDKLFFVWTGECIQHTRTLLE